MRATDDAFACCIATATAPTAHARTLASTHPQPTHAHTGRVYMPRVTKLLAAGLVLVWLHYAPWVYALRE